MPALEVTDLVDFLPFSEAHGMITMERILHEAYRRFTEGMVNENSGKC